AAQNRPQLIELIATWYAEAGKYNVLPIDSRGTARLADERPHIGKDRTRYVYYPNTSSIAHYAAPRVLNRPHSISARFEIEDGAEGVLVAQGGSSGGYSLYIKDKKLHYAYNYLGVQQFHLATTSATPRGHRELRFELEPTAKPDIAHGKGTP